MYGKYTKYDAHLTADPSSANLRVKPKPQKKIKNLTHFHRNCGCICNKLLNL